MIASDQHRTASAAAAVLFPPFMIIMSLSHAFGAGARGNRLLECYMLRCAPVWQSTEESGIKSIVDAEPLLELLHCSYS